MSDPYIGQITLFAGNFAPRNWMLCNGQILSIAEYDTLFALIGTTYGGDGVTTFALPDLRGRLPVHVGTGAGLPTIYLGVRDGLENVTLTSSQIPQHTHSLSSLAASGAAATGNATNTSPIGNRPASGAAKVYAVTAPTTPLNTASLENTGGNQAHPNLMPYVCVNYIIAVFGIFPSRN